MSSSVAQLGDVDRSHLTFRSASYSVEEDLILCRTYLAAVQKLNVGPNYSHMYTLWSRIEIEYHKALPKHVTIVRSVRSLQSRMHILVAAVDKLRACVQQVESLNQSNDASELDVLKRAKAILAKDPKFKKGFKFDHVWPLLKNRTISPTRQKRINLFNKHMRKQLLQNNEQAQMDCNEVRIDVIDLIEEAEEHSKSPGPSSSFYAADLNEERNKNEDEKLEKQQLIGLVKESLACMQQTQAMLEKSYQLQLLQVQNERRRIEAKRQREENKILARDIENIKDPILRKAIRAEQLRICEQRGQDLCKPSCDR